MPVLNHHIVAARDPEATARFFIDLLGLDDAVRLGGIYFDDPNGHRLEIITRPYGSGGTEAHHPHPLVAPTIEGSSSPPDIH